MTPASEALRALVSGRAPSRKGSVELAVLQAFFDDSGIGQPHAYCLAGFVARFDVWERFSAAWEEFLSEPPSLKYWKTSHAMSFKGQFTYWTKEQRDKKLRKACEIIQDHDLFVVSQTVLHKDFIDVLGQHSSSSKGWHPYKVLFYSLLLQLNAYAQEKGINEPIEVCFDTQTEHKSQIIQAWDESYRNSGQRSTVFTFPPTWHDEKDVLPIQSADLIAWELRQAMSRSFEGKTFMNLPWRETQRSDGVIHHLPRIALINTHLLSLYEHLVREGLWPDLWVGRAKMNVYHDLGGPVVRRRKGLED